jgi:hypothetical protein
VDRNERNVFWRTPEVTMDERRLEEMAERLDRLEQANRAMGRACRRWRLAAGGLLLAGLVLGVAGAASTELIPRTLEAQNFVLRDTAGRMRASLGFRADGTPGFALLDEHSRVRLALDLCAEGAPAVNLYSAAGRLQAAVAVRPDGSPALGFFDGQGQVRAALDLSHDETAPGLSLYDGTGTMRAAMAIRPDQTPGLGLFDAQGNVFLSLDPDTEGNRPTARASANARAPK